MQKTLLALLLLAFGLVFQVQAASTNSNQGTKADQTISQAQGNQGVGNTVQTEEQNKVNNQGEGTKNKTNEQNAVQTQDSATKSSTQGKTNQGDSNSNSKSNSAFGTDPSAQERSQVANAVQAMLQVADRNGGIGQQVRTIAQNQNQNQVKLEQNIEKIQGRGGFAKFFIGPNYGEIKDAQKTLEQNREQIRQLNQIRTQLSSQGDQQQLTEQIKILEQANQEIETLLVDSQSGFSLFGWLNKIVS